MNTRRSFLTLAGIRGGRIRGAFTLLEVMVATAIFFMVAFAILEMVTRSLVAVRAELRGRKTGWSRTIWRARSGAWRIGRCPAARA